MRILTSLISLLFAVSLVAQEPNIIPRPENLKWINKEKPFTLSSSTVIVLEGSNLEKTAAYLNAYLKKYYQYNLKVVKRSSSANVIRLNYERMDYNQQGAYMLRIDDKGIYLAGDNQEGVFNGVQTLIQLLPVSEAGKIAAKADIPSVYISDGPRFGYRGMHLDVARHFFPVDFIKKYIDYLALHKLNTFHWHLTDDQGWRIEIKNYPQLTTVGGWRNGTITGRYPGNGNDKQHYGGFYTQAEIKEVVKYAADRYIQVIPEIEMPGHASAAIAAYPQLSCFPDAPTYTFFPKDCEWNGPVTGKQVQQTWGVFEDVFCAGNDSTFIFLQNVLDEVLTLFPSKYIHVGGDECPKDNWKKCPRCQDRMRREGLTDEHHLQSYFIQRIEKHLNAKGRTLIGWDEILEGGLAPNAVVMSWRGEEGGITAAREKHNVIMSPGNPVYFDHTQSQNEDSVTIGGFNPLEKVYAYDPVPAKLQSPYDEMVLGAQANVWTEYMHNPSKVEYMIFPRMAALSEVLWSKKENKDWKSFEMRLGDQIKRYELWKANYSKAYFDLKSTVEQGTEASKIRWKLESRYPKGKIAFRLAGGQTEMAKFQDYTVPIDIGSLSLTHGLQPQVIAMLYDPVSNKTLSTINQQFHLNKATGKKITLTNPASDKYPGDGAFTLVNGVQNNKGFARSKEFLGFSGTDCEAVIDLGTSQSISNVSVRCLERTSSWIWPPAGAEVFGSADGQTWTSLKQSSEFSIIDAATGNGGISLSFPASSVRYIKVLVKNNGVIPAGNPGAGNKAWLFVDEIIAE